ncbi:hypothetical protein, partial [Achromobacter spanius]|uniref:hypothetical protein n=1 Tax=Achromobacter spanius TaxID=217203 RepID=UPI003D34B884
MLTGNGITISMSAKGDPYDNAVAEWTNPDFPDSLVKALRPQPEQGFYSLAPGGFAGGCRRP